MTVRGLRSGVAVMTVAAGLIAAACASPLASPPPLASLGPSDAPTQGSALPSPPPSAIIASPPAVGGPWRAVPIAASGFVTDVIPISGGGYLAVGTNNWNGAIWHSADGVTWDETTSVPPIGPQDAKSLSGVIQTPGGFLAWGGQGPRYSESYLSVLWTSTDGLHWQQSAVINGFVLDVIAGGPGYIAIGAKAGLDYLNGALAWSSVDAIAWTDSPTVPGVGDSAMVDVVPFGSGYVAVGATRGSDGWTRGLAWRSEDGIRWAQVSKDAELDAGLSRVLVAGDHLVAAGSVTVDPVNGDLRRPVIRVSDDGSTWTQTFAWDCCGEMTDIIDSGSGLLAVYRWYVPNADTGIALLASADGMQWVALGAPGLEAGISWIRLLSLGGSLGVVGLGVRDHDTETYEPLLLVPPAGLISN